MKSKRKTAWCFCAIATLSLSAVLYGQTPGVPPPPATEAETGGVANPISERVTARDLMRDFIAARQWQEGENQKPDGSSSSLQQARARLMPRGLIRASWTAA